MPSVSFITVVKDNAIGLERTVESVLLQSFKDWEIIVVVAPSTDSTLQVAELLALRDVRIQSILENAPGIYSAMNQGLARSRYDYCWFLNAGDTLAASDVVQNAVRTLESSGKSLVVGSHIVGSSSKVSNKFVNLKHFSAFSFAFSRKHGNHQSMLFRTQQLKKFGGYSLQYDLASDFEVVLKIILSYGAVKSSGIFAIIEPGGVADQNIFKVHKEKHKIRQDLFKSTWISLLSSIWTFLAGSKIILRAKRQSLVNWR